MSTVKVNNKVLSIGKGIFTFENIMPPPVVHSYIKCSDAEIPEALNNFVFYKFIAAEDINVSKVKVYLERTGLENCNNKNVIIIDNNGNRLYRIKSNTSISYTPVALKKKDLSKFIAYRYDINLESLSSGLKKGQTYWICIANPYSTYSYARPCLINKTSTQCRKFTGDEWRMNPDQKDSITSGLGTPVDCLECYFELI